MKYGKVFWRDLAERVIATYIQSFIGFIIAANTVVDVSTVKVAAVAAIPAALAVVKAFIAERIPGTVSPASLAPR